MGINRFKGVHSQNGYNNTIFIICLCLFLLLLTVRVTAAPTAVLGSEINSQTIEINFKNAAIVDVLRAAAELAGINLIADQSVVGTVTVHLQDVSFAEALDLLIRPAGLDYHWEGRTVVVASPERLDQLYADVETRTVKIKQADLASCKQVISGIYPGLNLQTDPWNNILVIKGEKKNVAEACQLLERLDRPKQIDTAIVPVEPGNVKELSARMNSLFPGLTLQPVSQNRKLLLMGQMQQIQGAAELIRELAPQRSQKTGLITIDHINCDDVLKSIKSIYPELNLQLNRLKRQVIVRGVGSSVDEALGLIRKLDTPRRQIIIQARVEEISWTGLKSRGVAVEKLTGIRVIKNNEGAVAGLGLTWPELIKIMEEEGSTSVLANPSLMALNGEEARLLIGDKIPVKLENADSENGADVIQYIEAGIKLQFRPWITGDNQIILDIAPRVSSIGKQLGTGLPPINTREVETRVRLQDGETFAIAGLIQDDDIEKMAGVPLLSEVPILGELFRHRSRQQIKTELVILITPHIVDESDDYSSLFKQQSNLKQY